MARLSISLLVLLLAALCTPVQADDTSPADEIEVRARHAYSSASYTEAAKLFLDAYKQGGKASLLFNAGLAYQKSNNWREASEQFSAYLRLAPGGSKSTEARSRLSELERFIAAENASKAQMAQQLAESQEAAAQSLRSAGNHVQAAAFFQKAYVANQEAKYLYQAAQSLGDAGLNREAMAAYERYLAEAPEGAQAEDAKMQLEVLKGQAAGEPIVETPAPLPGEVAPVPEVPKNDTVEPTADIPESSPPLATGSYLRGKVRNRTKEKWALRIGAVGAGSLIAAGVFGIQAYTRNSDLDDEGLAGCNDDRSVCSPLGLALHKSAQTAATRANIALGFGAVVSLTAWYLWSSAHEYSNVSTADLKVSPTMTPEEVGVAISGSWN